MVAKIMETTDYVRFELARFNRDVKKTRKLEKSMRAHGWLDAHPLHVVKNGSGKLLIKAGHHRFEVAKTLGIPVKYVICADSATINELEEATTPWSLKDYLGSYIRVGIDSYLAVEAYHKKTGISLSQCISLLSGESAGSSNKTHQFRRGELEIGDANHAVAVGDIVSHLSKSGIKFATASALVAAISRIVWLPEFNAEVFKQKISVFGHLFEKRSDKIEYCDLIEAIYNRSNREPVPLAFLADKAAKERRCVKSKG
jgi:hypothetical protein